MARRKRGNIDQPIGVGLTAKQMKRRKPLSADYLVEIDPLTDNQKRLFDSYVDGKHLVAYGCAGTGKTFITLYNALCDVLDERTPYERIYLVRSLVATREIGFLPGSHEDKADIYQIPYKNMVKYTRQNNKFEGRFFESPLFYVRDDIIQYGKHKVDSSNE